MKKEDKSSNISLTRLTSGLSGVMTTQNMKKESLMAIFCSLMNIKEVMEKYSL